MARRQRLGTSLLVVFRVFVECSCLSVDCFHETSQECVDLRVVDFPVPLALSVLPFLRGGFSFGSLNASSSEFPIVSSIPRSLWKTQR